MSHTRRVLYTALAATALTGTLTFAAATPAAAIPMCRDGYQCNYIWFTDAERETVSGGMTVFCDGTSDNFGSSTQYLQFTTVRCND
jgi:hypothetical protein